MSMSLAQPCLQGAWSVSTWKGGCGLGREQQEGNREMDRDVKVSGRAKTDRWEEEKKEEEKKPRPVGEGEERERCLFMTFVEMEDVPWGD